MKFQYLGTAAAEGFPAMFCTCDTCNRARAAGGKNIRTRSQAIIDDSLLIDFPADTYYHITAHNLPLEKIHHCIITHSHSDHFYPADFEMRRVGFAKTHDDIPFHVYGGNKVFSDTEKVILDFELSEEGRVAAHRVEPFVPFEIDDYTVTPLPADHDTLTSPVIYIIEKSNVAMLYAHDTGILSQNVWEWLKNSDFTFNFVSLDCTAGLLQGWRSGHLGLDTCVEFKKLLQQSGTVTESTKYCLNHFSHNCLADYDEMLTQAEKYGFDVSYDGKIIDF